MIISSDMEGPGGASCQVSSLLQFGIWERSAWVYLFFLAGVEGFRGAKGDVGDPGFSGIEGTKGSQGSPGFRGQEGEGFTAFRLAIGSISLI